jgi:diketogulonate reductase-like aldo/keto reductase
MTDEPNDRAVALSSGAAIPLLGFGTWALRGTEAQAAVRTALDAGYRHIDTATAYGNEEQVGRALRDSGVDRADVFLTTKLPLELVDKARAVIERSLQQLGIDHVDLWLIHWPDGSDPMVETWRELLAIRDEGKARAVGVSNYSPAQVDALIEATGEAPAVNQIRWSPWLYDESRLAHSRARGVALEGYSPFRASRLGDPVLGEIAAAHGVTPAQVVLRWHVQHQVVVIPKSASPERIRSNADVWDLALTDDEMARIDALSS